MKLSRLKLNDNQLPGKLSEETEIELFRTSLAEGMEFIGDLHDFDIATIGDERAAADVNRFLRGMPAGWGLTLLLAEHGMTWDVEGERVIVAIEKDLAAYKKLAAVREKRRLNYTPATSSKLRNSVYFNIHEADTNALLQLVSEKIGMKVSFGPKAQVHGKKTTVIHPADVPADVLLDMVAAHFGLTWTVNEQGEVVLHGTDWQPKN